LFDELLPKHDNPMRFLVLIFFFFTGTCGCLTAFAQQQIADPTRWTYAVQKVGDQEYELVFKLQLQSGWHIWSLTPGGDGFEIPPSFVLDENEDVLPKGKVTEAGQATTAEMEGIDGKVTYYSGSVVYTQTVIITRPTTITGEQEYQVCNDVMCLPPTQQKFSFEIK
jgi:thiol:disulfide interchange protein DsbD